MKIAVDAMGGDRAPADIVEGVVSAALERRSEIVLVGHEPAIRAELARSVNGHRLDNLSVRHASQIIGMGESPATAYKTKKDASMVVAARMVKEGEAAAFLSVGNTGAAMTSALMEMGRVEGVMRPAIAIPIPRVHGVTIVIDAGANVDCRPEHLAQFGVMGEIYAQQIHGVPNPRVGLLNVGEEEGKGNELTQEAFGLLKGSKLNFVGNIEGRDIPNGSVDVVVCDGFIGNVVLKFAEGVALTILQIIREEYRKGGPVALLGAWLSRRVFRSVKHSMDPATFGGAPLLGVNGTCIVGHGTSSPRAIRNAVLVAEKMVALNVNGRIMDRLRECNLARSRQ